MCAFGSLSGTLGIYVGFFSVRCFVSGEGILFGLVPFNLQDLTHVRNIVCRLSLFLSLSLSLFLFVWSVLSATFLSLSSSLRRWGNLNQTLVVWVPFVSFDPGRVLRLRSVHPVRQLHLGFHPASVFFLPSSVVGMVVVGRGLFVGCVGLADCFFFRSGAAFTCNACVRVI